MTIPDVQRKRHRADAGVGRALPDSRLRPSRDRHARQRRNRGRGRLAITQLDKQTWRIDGSGDVRVQYATFWDETGPFGTQLDGEHAFLNLAMVLCYVPDRRGEDTVVHFDRRAAGLADRGGIAGGWRAPTARATAYSRRITTRWWTRRWRSAASRKWQFQAGEGGRFASCCTAIRVDHDALTRTLTADRQLRDQPDGRARPSPSTLFILHVGRDLRRRRHGAQQLHGDSARIPARRWPTSARTNFFTCGT